MRVVAAWALSMVLLGPSSLRPAAQVEQARAEFHRRWQSRATASAVRIGELKDFPVGRLDYVFWLDAFLRAHARGGARTQALLAYFEVQSWRYGGLLHARPDESRAAELLGRLALRPDGWRAAPQAFLPAVLAAGGDAELARRLAPDDSVRAAVDEAVWVERWWRGDFLDLGEQAGS
jgi:hypothetical protein